MLYLCCCLASAAAAFVPGPALPARQAASAASAVTMETLDDLKGLATKLNPVVGYWDPLELAGYSFWDNTNEETIGWLRHAEIKHGRVAMMGFVGYCAQANGIHFPGALTTAGTTYADISAAGTPPEQWDALPVSAKWQIILAVGFLEWWSELRLIPGEQHYMKGGKPGYFPDFDRTPDQLPHWIGLNLYDPFKWSANLSSESKANRLIAEVNNGRLAMIGLMGFIAEAKVPGSVPLLKGIIPAYGGDIMAPLAVSTDWSWY